MAINALSLASTREYISRLDPHHPDKAKDYQGQYIPAGTTVPDPKKATRWKLGTLDSRVYGYLRDITTEIVQTDDGQASRRLAVNKMYREAVRFGLRGWENFKDHRGKEVERVTEEFTLGGKVYVVLTDKVLDVIPGEVIAELGQAIRDGNEVTEDEAKNSETPS